MSTTLGLKFFSALAVCGLFSLGVAWSYAPNPELLESKGFSEQSVGVIETQTTRQEWKTPPPDAMTPFDRIFHNIWINDWTGQMDPFGSNIIRERQ